MNIREGRRTGLDSKTARARLASVGPNRTGTSKEESLLEELLESFQEPLVLLLLAIGLLTFIFGQWHDALVILAVIFVVALTEAMIEWRAGRAITALSAMAEPKTYVWRDDTLGLLPTEEIVPGDLVHLRAGSRVPADATLVDASDLSVDESLVTGESMAVPRDTSSTENARLLAGTTVLSGTGKAIVTRTGARSTLGRIATLVTQAKEPRTPLQRRMTELAGALLWVAVAASVLIPLIGVVAGRPPREMLLTGLSLGFATVPEELSVLIVVVLGLGSLRLARRGAIVRRLVAAETLGSVTIICTDKTGTLTENRIVLSSAVAAATLSKGRHEDMSPAPHLLKLALRASEPEALDPVDRAIHDALPEWPLQTRRSGFHPFERSIRLASGFDEVDGRFEAGIKGAAEAILARCTHWRDGDELRFLEPDTRDGLLAAAEHFGGASRIVALASRVMDHRPTSREDLEHDLVFEGLLVFRDPVRSDVPAAVDLLKQAGIRIAVVTGDQASTAVAVADEAGIPVSATLTGPQVSSIGEDELARRVAAGVIVARAQPADKLRIVEALSAGGEIVMATGDGVNDAPALRAAAVGVAMGRAGSDAARQSAQVVLTNDSFATLVEAVREGRRLYDNFRKVIGYYLAVKLALILIMAAGAILGLPLAFTPVQIVILELFMDLGAALAFVNQPADPDLMKQPPRDPKARFLDHRMLLGISAGAVTLGVLVLIASLVGSRKFGPGGGHSLALVAWMVGHATLGLVMGGSRSLSFLPALLRNPPMLIWAGCAIAFAGPVVYVPSIGAAIGASSIPASDALAWGLAALLMPLWLTLGGRGVTGLRKKLEPGRRAG